VESAGLAVADTAYPSDSGGPKPGERRVPFRVPAPPREPGPSPC